MRDSSSLHLGVGGSGNRRRLLCFAFGSFSALFCFPLLQQALGEIFHTAHSHGEECGVCQDCPAERQEGGASLNVPEELKASPRK